MLISSPQSTSREAVVIGAGFGGLSLAIRLQSAGIQCTLLEKRDKPLRGVAQDMVAESASLIMGQLGGR